MVANIGESGEFEKLGIQVDDEGDEPTRNERLSSLRLAQNLLQDQKNCLDTEKTLTGRCQK